MNIEDQHAFTIASSPLPLRNYHELLLRALHHSSFKVLTETRLSVAGDYPHHTNDCTVLILWSPFLAYQTLRLDPNARLMLPFCLILRKDKSGGSRLLAPNYRQVEACETTLAGRVLAHVLESQIRQLLSEVSDLDAHEQALVGGGPRFSSC